VGRSKPAPKPAATTDATVLARLRAEARTARERAVSQGIAPDVMARADSAVARADSLAGARRTTEAAAELSVAIATWRNAPAAPAVVPEVKPPPVTAPPAPPPAAAAGPPAAPPAPTLTPAAPAPPADPSPRVRALFAEYAGAIETRSVPAIRKVYPGLTDKQASDWTQFFKAVSDVKVGLQVTRLDVRGDVGEVELAGVYIFTDPGTRRMRQDSVSLHSTVRRDARGGWHIESVR
jgi:hypothetical protein